MNKLAKTIFICLSLMVSLALSAAPVLVKMQTNRGDIYLELYPEKAPLSVANFTQYIKEGFYNGTIFHRVISNFMIQGGGYDQDLVRKNTNPPIQNEAGNGLKNLRGTIAMARTNDPHSGTSQFFINVVDNPALDFTGEQNSRTWGYAVFGKVIEGMDVVDEIKLTPTGPNPPFRSDVPIKTIKIESVSVIDKLPSDESKTTEEPVQQ
ncbi:MAG: peptidylprolyl isomerase [Gammaproteobacteria bacterium]|jgi:cyclophilin family peptidyl-prolyl cis-trans isomerase